MSPGSETYQIYQRSLIFQTYHMSCSPRNLPASCLLKFLFTNCNFKAFQLVFLTVATEPNYPSTRRGWLMCVLRGYNWNTTHVSRQDERPTTITTRGQQLSFGELWYMDWVTNTGRRQYWQICSLEVGAFWFPVLRPDNTIFGLGKVIFVLKINMY